ncbi:helix-turn-helix transcriptional regulator [Streptomyces sp. NPDC004134]|uniref:helix-turn-helix transcriptional regulator n=1 Tax=Streptomyces sp. NPDC004134 TaxID=3364691 RepID=UPI0036A559CD
MRAARLIHLVLLLQSRPSMTAAELAERLEVSERTVARDVQALGEAGVPVYADRGRTGGYRLVGGYRTRLTGLGRTEAEALFLSGVPGALRDMGLADAGSAARLKVSAALLPELRGAPESAAQRFHLDAPGWWREPDAPELLPAVAEAVWADRTLAVTYRRRPGAEAVEREVEPYGLVLKAGVWYLVARVPEAGGAYRVYRVERFERASAVGGGAGGAEGRAEAVGGGAGAIGGGAGAIGGGAGFERDEEFDLPGFWAERAAAFARSILRDEVTLRLSPDGLRRLPHVTDRLAAEDAVAGAGEPDERGWTAVRLRVESADVAYTQLLALGPDAELLGPPELRARFAAAAARSAELYGRSR